MLSRMFIYRRMSRLLNEDALSFGLEFTAIQNSELKHLMLLDRLL